MNGQKEITDLVRGGNLPLQENIPSFLKKMVMFSKKTLMFNNKLGMFLRNIKVFLQHAVRAVYL